MSVTLYDWRRIPEESRFFWQQRVVAQDDLAVLTRSPAWFEMMAENAFDAQVAVARDVGGRTRALLPCLIGDQRIAIQLGGRALVTRLFRLARVSTGYAVNEVAEPNTLAAMMQAVLLGDSKVEGVLFEDVPEGPALEAVRDAARRLAGCFLVGLMADAPHYRLRLPPSWEALRRRRSSRTLAKIRYRERALAEAAGALRLVHVRKHMDWQPYADRIQAMMDETWQARRLGHRFRVEDMAGLASREWLHGYLWLAGETPAAFALCYQGIRNLVYAEIGYHPAWAEYSPGIGLLYRLLESLYEEPERPLGVDFGVGEAEYKRQWADERRVTSSVVVLRRRLRHYVFFSARRVLAQTARMVARGRRGLRGTAGAWSGPSPDKTTRGEA